MPNKTLRQPKPSSRKSLPMMPTPREQVDCLACGLCCTYISLEINGPTTVKRASEILWQLYHERVSVYRDSDDEWYVQFETRCQHLQADNKCGIYEQRPHVCREYSEVSCEINAEDAGQSFYNAAEFLEFLKVKRKRVYAQLSDGFMPRGEAAMTALSKKKNGDYRKRFTVLRGQ
jgi:Fe-S-cluster containining protein